MQAQENNDLAAHPDEIIGSKDSKKTVSVKKQAMANTAALKAKLAGVKVDKAMALRQKARVALKNEGKSIPATLAPGALSDVKARADQAIQKAEVLKAKAAEDAARAGTTPAGVAPGDVPTCYEAELANYPECGGYREEGFSCSEDAQDGRTGYCAASKCIGTCDKCSKKAPSGYVVNIKTGRCEKMS